MSTGRWMDKGDVVHIHNGILFSHKKECPWISSNEADETATYYTEWSKSKREAPILFITAYIWNLERQQLWPYMQGSRRDTDVSHRPLDTVGEGKGGMIWEDSIETCIFMYIAICKVNDQCKFDAWSRAFKAGALGQPRGMEWRGR